MSAEAPASRQVEGRLAVREEETAVLVVREEDPEDWLARFEKAGGFPAREWADNMASVYNRRLALGAAGPTNISGSFLAGHQPDTG